MKAKLVQLLALFKAISLYVFKIALRVLKVTVEETILILQLLDKLLTKETNNGV